MFGFAEANRSQSAIGEPLGDSISQTEKSLTQHESAESAEKTAVNGIFKKNKQRKPCTHGIFAFHSYQWPLQVPKLEVLYHIKPYFGSLSPLHSPYIDLIYGS